MLSKIPFGFLLLLGACTTAPAQPSIAAFSETVLRTSSVVEERYKEDNIAALFQEEKDAAMIDGQAFYDLEGCEGPISLSIDPGDAALDEFTEHCNYGTFQARGDRVEPFEISPAIGEPGISGENAARLSRRLIGYAEALGRLANSSGPAELADDFETAAASVLTLANETMKLRSDGDPVGDQARALAEAGSGLASTILQGAFEARRYRLLRSLVNQSDPSVQLASRAIAGWFRGRTSQEIIAGYEELEAAKQKQQTAVLELRSGEGSSEIAIAAFQKFREAYEELERLETSAEWRFHLAVAQAHGAIRTSLNNPGNLESLAYANERIDELVTKGKEFFEAIEAESEGGEQ